MGLKFEYGKEFISDDRYAVSNGSRYTVLISWDGYAILDRELDTPYSMEVDTPYSTVEQNSEKEAFQPERLARFGLEVSWIRRIHVLDTTYWGFLGVGTTLDIFQNIILIPYLEYGVLSPLDTAY
ncbi:hypothetical protein Tco_0410456 [Tanacetum coccineum]